jgi:spermidine/putrescine-binding protein
MSTRLKTFLLSLIVFIAVISLGNTVSLAAQETIRITCWEGYANSEFIDAFKRIVKDKYKIDVEIKPSYATGQEDFYKAAKDGTADLISPPADTLKTPRFNCFS